MDKKKVLELNNHIIYYIKTNGISYYITIPKKESSTTICIELKSKMDNYNLDMNDDIWVMENVKNAFSYIDNYNITLILPVLDEQSISILEKLDTSGYDFIDKIMGTIINDAYHNLKDNGKVVNNQVILIDNDRYKTFISWFSSKYNNRIICKTLLEVIQAYNVNATSYKKFETPAMTFVVGSYASEVDAPKVIKDDEEEDDVPRRLATQTSGGFTSYWLLAIITILVAGIVAFIAFTMK